MKRDTRLPSSAVEANLKCICASVSPENSEKVVPWILWDNLAPKMDKKNWKT